jgi:hypothetical protein
MSGIEIVAGVAGIISAFCAVGNIIKKSRNERKAKKKALKADAVKAEQRLATTIDEGPPAINNEYNRNLQRLGDQFKRGDGKYTRIGPLFADMGRNCADQPF